MNNLSTLLFGDNKHPKGGERGNRNLYMEWRPLFVLLTKYLMSPPVVPIVPVVPVVPVKGNLYIGWRPLFVLLTKYLWLRIG